MCLRSLHFPKGWLPFDDHGYGAKYIIKVGRCGMVLLLLEPCGLVFNKIFVHFVLVSFPRKVQNVFDSSVVCPFVLLDFRYFYDGCLAGKSNSVFFGIACHGAESPTFEGPIYEVGAIRAYIMSSP